ncbi:MAG: 23S rRNA (cytosine(1962)-C(5))-methyltransferase RlmI [Chloroflexi bacterium]|nr:23S rRNA (cytosine(1962)-C(5))-methyltransferase RlmI [Chloroflexota bacterium]
MTGTIVIKQEREKPIRNQHPWIFSGAIAEVRGNPTPGEIVTVLSHKGVFIARGYWNPKSQIQVRILTWQDEAIDEAWWRRMLKRAVEARSRFAPDPDNGRWNTAYRVINAESDFLPGLIVDQYDQWLVLQALTLHINQQKATIARLLMDIYDEMQFPVKGIYERSDVDVRKKEGLSLQTGILLGEEPPELIWIQILPLSNIGVDIRHGQKTGTYLDQVANHQMLWNLFSFDKPFQVLNLFSYTGAFGLHAAAAGAEKVIDVDASRDALELAEKTVQKIRGNSTIPKWHDVIEYVQADVFEYLRDIAEEGQQFDVVICDPPKFASSAQQVERAARGYKDLNLNSFKLIKPGGYLMTFSCSGAISRDLFQKIVFGALADSGRQAQIIRHLSAGEDHPVALTFPEGEYLKGLLLRVY